jgi:hypothetical protein
MTLASPLHCRRSCLHEEGYTCQAAIRISPVPVLLALRHDEEEVRQMKAILYPFRAVFSLLCCPINPMYRAERSTPSPKPHL